MINKINIQGLLLDFDGVVVDSMKNHFKSWSKAFKLFDIYIDELSFYLLEGQGIDIIAHNLAEKYGLNKDEKKRVLVSKIRDYYQHEKVSFFPGFIEFLNKVKQQDLKVAVVTGGNKNRVMPVVEDHLSGYFEAIITYDDVQNGKPNPEPYLKGAEKLNLIPENCLVIENAPLGIESAKKAGCTVIALTSTLPEKYLLKADFIVDSFYDAEKLLIENKIIF